MLFGMLDNTAQSSVRIMQLRDWCIQGERR